MQIPNKIKIGFKEYEVQKNEGNIDDGTRLLYGRINFDKGTIDIANSYSLDIQLCTLIHEAIHGIDDIFGIDGLKQMLK